MHELVATGVDLLYILAAEKRIKKEQQVRRPRWLRKPRAFDHDGHTGQAGQGSGARRGRPRVTKAQMDHAFNVILSSKKVI